MNQNYRGGAVQQRDLNGTAHLTNSSSIAFEGNQSFNSGTISFDDTTNNVVEMQAAGTLTLGATAAIRGNTGTIGGSHYFGAAMTLVNQGLISAEVSGRTITVAAASFTNSGTSHALNGATLSINNLASPQSGTIGAGVGSTVTINGNITEGATGAINVDIGGAAAGQFGKINITGAATLAGTLTATFVNGFAPSRREQFPSNYLCFAQRHLWHGDRSQSTGRARNQSNLQRDKFDHYHCCRIAGQRRSSREFRRFGGNSHA